MLFSSMEFIFFFLPIILLCYSVARIGDNAFGNQTSSKLVLALASICFYGVWRPEYLWILGASVLFNYGIATLMMRALSGFNLKLCLLTGIVFNLSLLFFFKYLNFFILNVNSITSLEAFSRNIVLPLGISFFTFQQISYLVDRYSAQGEYCSFLDYVLFVAFFPQLIAGPIVHHAEMMPQFKAQRDSERLWTDVSLGFFLFSCGLAKKIILADTLSRWVGNVFDTGNSLSFFEAWGGALSYTFQLYFDFSGYCDMAIGLGLLFGIRLPVNFSSPYKSSNIAEFWRSWHMTLGRWFRDYLYIPLGGNRCPMYRNLLNLFIVMFLCGLWHGAAWTFVLWGALHGVALMAHVLWKKLGGKMPQFWGWMTTFVFVVVAWVPFRAVSFVDASRVLKAMFPFGDGSKIFLSSNAASMLNNLFGLNKTSFILFEAASWNFKSGTLEMLPWLFVASFIAFVLPNTMEVSGFVKNEKMVSSMKYSPTNLVATVQVGVVFALAATWMMASTGSEFIYFNF